MAIAFVANTGNINGTAITSLEGTLSQTVAAGNFVVVAIRIGADARTITVTNDVSGTATLALTKAIGGGNAGELSIFYFENSGAATTVTVAISGAGTAISFTVHEYSGIATSGALDKTASASDTSGTSTTLDSGPTIETEQADELLFGGGTTNTTTTMTAGTNYLNKASSPSGAGLQWCSGEDQIVAATSTYSATFTLAAARRWACGIATFKGATTGSTWPGYIGGGFF